MSTALHARLMAWKRAAEAGEPVPEPLFNIAEEAIQRLIAAEDEKQRLKWELDDHEYTFRQLATMNLRTYGG